MIIAQFVELVPVFILFALGAWCTLTVSIVWGLSILGLMGLWIGNFDTIPNKPPSIGLLTIWFQRTNIVLKEGLHILPRFIPPLFIGFVSVNVKTRNKDVTFENLRCMDADSKKEQQDDNISFELNEDSLGEVPFKFVSGALVNIPLGYTYAPGPDGEDYNNFINKGEDSGIEDILREKIAEVLRSWCKAYTWEEVVSSGSELVLYIIARLTGEKVSAMSPERKQALIGELENGKLKVPDLGICISRLNIGEIVVLGKTAVAAEKRAEEIQQRDGYLYERGTEIAEAEMLHKAIGDENVTLFQILEGVRKLNRIEQGHGKIFDIRGLDLSKLKEILGSGGDQGGK